MRVLIAGVGYRNLRDYSAGNAIADLLEQRSWPDDVVVEDLSYNPIAVVQRLDDEPAERRFDRVIAVGAAERSRRTPGTVTAYRWDGVLPPEEQLHRAVTEAVTGVIALDNTLVIARHFGALPGDVVVIEVEPADHEFGDDVSAPVGRAITDVCALVSVLVADPEAAARLPRTALGGRVAERAAVSGASGSGRE